MFGGIMAYLDGNPFLTLYNRGIGIKVKGALYDELCTIEGAEPVRYEPTDPPSKSYVMVPAEWLTAELAESDPLVTWAQRAAEQVLSAPKKKKK